MKRTTLALWLVPLVLAAVFWFWPPRGRDSYHHTINAVEQARAWREGALLPRYHRGWNGGTGTFAPTIYSPVPLFVQGGLAQILGDGRRAVGISLAAAFLAMAAVLKGWSRDPAAVMVILTPYVLAVALLRSTTTEAWALVGAAAVLPLAMPPTRVTRRRGFGLAIGVFWVAGCQVGMLLQIAWLLGAAWTVSLLQTPTVSTDRAAGGPLELARTAAWGVVGLCVAAALWLPAVVDARHLAIRDLVDGPLDWRNNFLPDGSALGVLLTATALSLAIVALIVIRRGVGSNRLPLAVAVLVGVALATPLSTPLWHLSKMENLQYPWRFLGPSTLIAVLALGSLRGRWRVAGFIILLLPLVILPVSLGTSDDAVPTASTPEELALIAQEEWSLAPTLPSEPGFYSKDYHLVDSLDLLTGQRAKLEVIERDVGGGRWRVTQDIAGSVLLPLQWWPEWRIAAGGHDLAYTNRRGLVEVELEAGTVEIHAALIASRSRSAGALLSGVGLAVLVLLLVLWRSDRDLAPACRGAA